MSADSDYRRLIGRALLLLVAVLLTLPCLAIAQVWDSVALGQETIASDFFGVGARAMAMGNAGLALSQDGSAMIYNPACLARIKRMEFRAGLSHFKGESDARVIRGEERFDNGDDLSKTRINALSLVVPVPTYRGSLVFAFGLHRINSFDRAFARHFRDEYIDGFVRDSGRVLETGSIWKWTAAGAVDISPRLSTGLSVHVLTGKDEFLWQGDYVKFLIEDNEKTTFATYEDQTIEVDYLGVAATAGLNYAISQNVTAALTVETPTYFTTEENATYDLTEEYDTASSTFIWESIYETEFSRADYSLTRPFAFGFGLAGTFERFNLVGDIRYTDWTQLGFDYESAALDADEAAAKRFIMDNLTDVLSIHLGGELLFPEHGLSVRAGYFRDPLPVDERFIESERQYLTAGVGFLIDRIMTLDLAYVHGGYELRDGKPGSFFAKYKTRRIFATFGYRI